MIATSHVIIGGAAAVAAGAITQNPAIALLVGIASHFLCDSLPHLDTPPNTKFEGEEVVWDKTLFTFAITDSVFAMLLTLLIWVSVFDFQFFSVYAWGALGGYLPDLLDNFPLWSRKIHNAPGLRTFHRFHLWIHYNWMGKFPMPKYWKLGVATQVILVIPCLYYLLN